MFKFGGAKTQEEQEAVGEAIVAAAVKELEPLLGDAKPFFGGSDKIGLAEVRPASFHKHLPSTYLTAFLLKDVSSNITILAVL